MSEYIHSSEPLENAKLVNGMRMRGMWVGPRQEKIVRCKDCAKARKAGYLNEERLMCAEHRGFNDPDDFCSHGEER